MKGSSSARQLARRLPGRCTSLRDGRQLAAKVSPCGQQDRWLGQSNSNGHGSGITCSREIERAYGYRTFSSKASGEQSREYTREGEASSSSLPATTDLLELYRGLVAQGKLTWDDEQVRCVLKLKSLLEDLRDYTPPIELLSKIRPRDMLPKQQTSWWKGKARATSEDEDVEALVRVLSSDEELANLNTPKGIMITGPPGTGKSMLLALFFDALPTRYKRRWHYHAFTLYLYRRVFVELQKRRDEMSNTVRNENLEKAASKGWKSVFAGGQFEGKEDGAVTYEDHRNLIPFIIAKDMIMEYHILYFDELQLVDASSAALLRDVLTWYWRLGGVMVTCSNRVPDSLYHAGVQKERMSGFLDTLKARCEVVELDGGRDWRQSSEDTLSPQIRWTDDPGLFEAAWQKHTQGVNVSPTHLSVYGRTVPISQSAGMACRFSFSELCEQPLGPADYISLASKYIHFFISDLPTLYLRNKNEARRLINLIDALYEARCQVHILANAPLDEIFFPDALIQTKADNNEEGRMVDVLIDTNDSIMAAESLSETLHAAAHPNVSVYNPGERAAREKREEKEADKASAFGVLGIWTGEDERFAYKRAVSRLTEMTTSPSYLLEGWRPLDILSRSWETSGSLVHATAPVGPASHSNLQRDNGEIDHDFATEAAYSRPQFLQSPPNQDDKPKISEKHVWGVVDGWGPKAGEWGKGAKAFGDSGKVIADSALPSRRD